MGSFLYGNNNRQGNNLHTTGGQVKKSVSRKGQKANINNNNNRNMTKTATQFDNKQKVSNNTLSRQNNSTTHPFAETSFPQQQQNINIYSPFEESEYENVNESPPMMEFTNTIKPDQQKQRLTNQLQELSNQQLSLYTMKFKEAYNSTTKNKQLSKNVNINDKDFNKERIKILKEYLMMMNKNINHGENKNNMSRKLITTKDNKMMNNFREETVVSIKVDREELRIKAKQELSAYKGTQSVKIPILKDGTYQFIELSELSEEEIKKYAQKQKELEFEEEMKKEMERQLQKKDKENQRLRKELEEKDKQYKRREEQVKKEREEELAKKQLLYEQQEKLKIQKLLKEKKEAEVSEKEEESNNDDNEDSSYNYDDSHLESSLQQKKEEKPKHSLKYQPQEEEEEENYYESDFESVPSVHKQSKASLGSSQKLKGEESYIESYDPDFESYSQSFLDSKLKLSASEISEGNNYYETNNNKKK